jgi:ribonuclease-3
MNDLSNLQTRIGYAFKNSGLLLQSLTHRSFANEESGGTATVAKDNERLEFLGDAVLDLAMSAILMSRFSSDPEGSLSKKRASLVNEEILAQLALELGLDQMMRLGKGEAKSGGLTKPRILASTCEAILGGVFLDAGFDRASLVIEKLFSARLEAAGQSTVDYRTDFKTRLQERAQEIKRATPVYAVEGESGPDHDKVFEVAVMLAGERLAKGVGKSKKAAEQDAARQALETLETESSPLEETVTE